MDDEEESKTEDKNYYDIAKEIKKVQSYKPTEGVKFKEYDELGLPKNDGFDYKKFIVTDSSPTDTVIEADPE